MSIGCTAAAAVMARRVLEGIVNEQQAKGRTLHAKLADLHTRKMLSDDLLAWSLAIKDIGNEAAHGISTTTPADARFRSASLKHSQATSTDTAPGSQNFNDDAQRRASQGRREGSKASARLPPN